MNDKKILMTALREAAQEIQSGTDYHWGHMGSCNCGFLAQKLTGIGPAEIHRTALSGQGDWSEQVNDYCPSTGLPMDELIFGLLQYGLRVEDLAHLERLSDPRVLLETKKSKAYLTFNDSQDVALYMNTWAGLLESQMNEFERPLTNNETNIPLPDLALEYA